ncbi:hypothetical protein BDV27DRAFT_18374 [Aspergillus caelatus]|uniref:Uncharacterized protein n=1 Tax=Aspergillus caelatus TaxID=61420 RepID=A0A5N6ZYJ1_9EURO|nr:uncharacterized protein BDV27DRAFT_18374 [Aspergillus caelatus]KAE8362428.1 hypothetical protein BDV27DRAFT_18374 [Aspergillus caelatus]
MDLSSNTYAGGYQRHTWNRDSDAHRDPRKAKRSSDTGKKTKKLLARRNTEESELSTTLPDEVKTNITSWKDDPLSFFVKGSDVNLELDDCIGGFYSCLVSLESRQGLDSIRTRFLNVSFFTI